MTKTCPPEYEEYSTGELILQPLQVEVGESFEEGLRRFKSLIQRSKILTLYKESQSYEKPSEKRRRKKREIKERMRLATIREKQIASGEWDKKQKRKEMKRKRRQTEDYE